MRTPRVHTHLSRAAVAASTLLLCACSNQLQLDAAPVDVVASSLLVGPASGSRPLLVVLSQRSASIPLAHSPGYYRQLLFGPSFPNVVDYFHEISNGKLTLTEAGVVAAVAAPLYDDPIVYRAQIPDSETDDAQRGRYLALQLAEEGGFDFSEWDADGDGFVFSHELAILQIDAASEVGGQNGAIACTWHSGVQVCPSVALTGERGELMLYAHELTHQLIGAVDLYGLNQNLNTGMTTMGPTASADATFVYYLDPYHRRAAEWEERFAIAESSSSGSFTLSGVADPNDSSGARGGILLRLGASVSESIYFEYREAYPGTYDQDAFPGVYAWLVALNETQDRPRVVPALSNPNVLEEAVFLLAPDRCVGDPNSAGSRGVVGALAVGSSYRLRWLDGNDSGLLFRISASSDGRQRIVSWSPSTATPSCP